MKQNLKVNLVWLGLLIAGFALIQVLVAAGVLNLFYIQILEQIGINIILAVGLNLIVGFSGQFSLGHAGFMAIGAYSAAILGSKSPTYGAFFGAMVLGALIAGVVALIVGVPTLRLKGDYLAIATLGVSEIIRILIVNGGTLTNGAAGILGLPAFTTWQLVYLFVVITTIFTINFLRSPIGRSTLSVREDEIAAESVGINTTKVKVIAFVFGAITAAIAGSLQAGFIGSVVPKDYSFTNTINVLIIVVFGGLGSMSGTVVAAIVLGILNMVLQDFSSVRMIIYSLALILVMIFRPGGLLGTWEFSLKKLLSVVETHQTGTISLVLGSTGNKGESRRKDFGLLLEEHPEIQVFLTADDPNYEDPLAIAEEISSYITRPVEKIADREQAIQVAMATTSKPEDAVIIAGKGADCYQIVNGVKEEYPGDAAIAERYL